MKVGDLICYNAAGQKNKTLGLLYAISWNSGKKIGLIQWCVIGDVMPRPDYTKKMSGADRFHIEFFPGRFVWHELGSWFEIAASP